MTQTQQDEIEKYKDDNWDYLVMSFLGEWSVEFDEYCEKKYRKENPQ